MKDSYFYDRHSAKPQNVIGHFKKTTLKHLIFILTILLLTGFTTADRQEIAVESFKIEISYIGLPHPVTTKFSIDNNRLTVYQTHYDSKKNSFVDFNKASFKKFDKVKLFSFIHQTDWKNIPEKLVTPTIDGFHYTVRIKIENASYLFDIDNTYHPTFDSLFTICNKLIPNKKRQKMYYLPYSDWRPKIIEPEKKETNQIIDSTCIPIPDTLDGQPVFKVTDKKAEFPNGQDSLMRYLAKSIKYPNHIEYQGSVYIAFVVDSNGKIRNVCSYKRFRSDRLTPIEKECIRVIEEMPDWTPAELNGQRVYSREILPIKFKLSDKD